MSGPVPVALAPPDSSSPYAVAKDALPPPVPPTSIPGHDASLVDSRESAHDQNLHASSSLPTPPPFNDNPASLPASPATKSSAVASATRDADPVVVDFDAVVGGGDAIDGGMDAELADALDPAVPVNGSSFGAPNGANGHASPDRLLSPVTPAEAVTIAESLPLEHISTPIEKSPVPTDVVASTDSPAPPPTASVPLPAPSAIPPPPAIPLPTYNEIPHPPAAYRTDSLSSVAAQPPTPSPAPFRPPPAPAPQYAPPASTPAPYPADVKMEEPSFSEAFGTKRAAPLTDEGRLNDGHDVKRARVESELPHLSHNSSFTSATSAPSPSPSHPSPAVPVSGYDPSAFTAASVAPVVPPPTISPSDLHNLHNQPPAPAPLPVPVMLGWPTALRTAPVPQIGGPVAVMTKAQQKAGLQLLRTLKKHRSAPAFLHPVDPVALGVPDYLRVIPRPMDLGTVESKLNATGKAMTQAGKMGRTFGLDYTGTGQWEGMSSHVYRTAADFKEDVDRIWDNCFRYNGPKDQNPVSAMAAVVQEVSDKLFKTMPSAPSIEYKPEPPRMPTPEVVKKERRPSNSFVPTIRRSEEGSRPKREIHPPARELPYEQADGGRSRHGYVSGKTAQEQVRFCKEVIRELFKKVHESYAYPFYEPVNYVALNIPQYPSIVRKPMDLGTVKARVEQNLYPAPAYVPFENDVRQVFKNCYLFNPPGTSVHDMGRKLEGVFDAKWEERPLGGGDDDDEYSEDDTIAAMERQLQTLQADLEAMKAQKKLKREQKRAAERVPKPPKPSTSKKAASTNELARNRATMQNSAAHRKRPSGGSATKKTGKKARKADSSDEEDYEEEYEEEAPVHASSSATAVSFEMKRELAEKIVRFEGENLERAIDIIRQGRPELLSDANKEIELDIDQLDQRTLLALYRYVCPSPPGRKPQKAAAKGRAPTGGTKRKNLDEIKESERIEMLEARLRDFENGGAADSRRSSAVAADQASSDSSSSDGDSGSDSDDED